MVLQIRDPVGIVWAVRTLKPVFVIFSIVTGIVIKFCMGIGDIGTWSWCDGQDSVASSDGC